MKLGIDIRHLGRAKPSGVGQYTLGLLEGLAKGPHAPNIELVSTGRGNAKRFITEQLGEHARTLKWTHHAISNRWLNLRLRTRQQKLSNLFSQTPNHLFLPNWNFIGAETVPYSLTVHDLTPQILPETYTLKRRLWHAALNIPTLIQNAEHVFVPSKSTASDIQIRYGRTDTHVIKHGQSPLFTSETEEEDETIRTHYRLPNTYLFFLGNLEARKNLKRVLEAYNRCVQKNADTPAFVFAGEDSMKLRDQIPKTIKDRVHLLGYIPDTHRPALLRMAHATLFPSLYEGFGMPVTESLACATPVITSSNSALLEINNTGCVYVDPYNVHDIERAITEIEKKRPPVSTVQQPNWETVAKTYAQNWF